MLVNLKLNREIADLEAEISLLEDKRTRSQGALLNAVLDGTEPSAEDMDYFRLFTAQIEVKRERLQNLIRQRDGK